MHGENMKLIYNLFPPPTQRQKHLNEGMLISCSQTVRP